MLNFILFIAIKIQKCFELLKTDYVVLHKESPVFWRKVIKHFDADIIEKY